MNDGSFILYIYFRARARPRLPTHSPRTVPVRIGSELPVCLPAAAFQLSLLFALVNNA